MSARADTTQIHWMLLISRQGKVRLAKWFEPFSAAERAGIMRSVVAMVLTRTSKMCNVVDWKDTKVVYKRYASLYFVACVDASDNELLAMEMLHMFVEVLDKYFSNVCELDLIFNFTRAYWILDEMFISGELQESNKAAVLAAAQMSDAAAEPIPEFGPKAMLPGGSSSSSSHRR